MNFLCKPKNLGLNLKVTWLSPKSCFAVQASGICWSKNRLCRSIYSPVGMESMPTQKVWYPRSHMSQNIISSSWWGCWHTVQVLHSMHCQRYVWIMLTSSSLISKQDGWPEVHGHVQRSRRAGETHTNPDKYMTHGKDRQNTALIFYPPTY